MACASATSPSACSTSSTRHDGGDGARWPAAATARRPGAITRDGRLAPRPRRAWRRRMRARRPRPRRMTSLGRGRWFVPRRCWPSSPPRRFCFRPGVHGGAGPASPSAGLRRGHGRGEPISADLSCPLRPDDVALGPFADLFGRRPVILSTLTPFTVRALASAAAPSVGWFIAWRVASDLGASGVAGPVPDRRRGRGDPGLNRGAHRPAAAGHPGSRVQVWPVRDAYDLWLAEDRGHEDAGLPHLPGHRRDRHALAKSCRRHQGHRSSPARPGPGRATGTTAGAGRMHPLLRPPRQAGLGRPGPSA